MMLLLLMRIPQYTWHDLPLFIKACFIVSILALAGIVLSILLIYTWRRNKKKKEQRLAELTDRINQLILPVVLSASSSDVSLHADDVFRSLDLSDKEVRRALVKEMMSFRSYFSGDIANRIRRLYLELSLDRQAIKKLHHSNWAVRVYTMMELFKMDVAPDLSSIWAFTKDRNEYVRDYAWLLLIKFTEGDPLDVLREMQEPISRWEAFEIFYLFRERVNYTPGSMQGLISMDREPSIVSLALQLVVYFRELSAAGLVMQLLQSDDLVLREQAVDTLGRLGLKTSGDHLANMYADQPYEIQIAILTALGRIQSSHHLDFLEHVFLQSEDFGIKKHASDAIIKLYPLSRRMIDRLLDQNDTGAVEQRILHHSLNPLINAV